MILDCASERYKCCVLGGGKHVLSALSSEYDQLTEQSELDEALLKRTVKKITVGHTGEFTVYFIGDIGLFSVIAQSESENISANVKWGVQQRMRSGTYMTNFNCYGYRKGDDGIPVIVEEEALIIKKIYQLFIDGYRSISECLLSAICAHIKRENGFITK